MEPQTRLTSGSITSQLLGLCFPLLCANILQQLYNITNSLVVTHFIGDNAFAALVVAESVMNLYIFVITGACMGASVLVAQFYGEGNQARLRQQLFVSAVLIGGCTLFSVLLGHLFLPQLLELIHTPENLQGDVSAYLRIILTGMVFTFLYNFCASSLRAIGNTKVALYFLLISLGYNILASLLLVAVLDMGIVGTALATASAQLLSSGLCLLYIQKKVPFLRVGREDMRMDPQLARLTVSYGAVAGLQQSSLYLGKLMVQSAVNDIGEAAISAFGAASRIENFTQSVGISGSEAAAIFVAQNRGAKEDRRALRGFGESMAILIGVGLLLSAVMHVAVDTLLWPFLSNSSAEAFALGTSYLHIISWFYVCSFIGLGYVGYYRGTGRMNITFFGTTLQVSIRVIGTYLLVSTMGLDAVALSTGLGWAAIVVFHTTVFILERRGIWPRRTL